MKTILYFFTLLFYLNSFACDCNPQTVTEKYSKSDFVANITIIKTYPNKKNEKGYKADIKVNELFKGSKLKSIYIYGINRPVLGGSCDIFIEENTKLIAYAHKNKEGNYGIGMCSGLMYLDYSAVYRKKTLKTKNELKKQKRELLILKTLKENNITNTSRIDFKQKTLINHKLEQFKGIQLDKEFGFYEITFNSNLSVKNVITISGFNKDIDKKLLRIIKETEWSLSDSRKNSIPDNSKLLFCIYYYPNEKGYPSFLSQFYH